MSKHTVIGEKAVVLFLLFFISHGIRAQFADFGQDPASLRWKQIETENFQIIYPDFFEINAQKIANIYQTLYTHGNTLAHKPAKISMIIHANGGISNGSVAWAPKRTDLYAMPSQSPSDTWLEHLCVHEFRHVVQIDKVYQEGMRNATKFLYYMFGEQFTIAATGVYLPLWFMEGDAVTYETALGKLGRGRSPEFLNEMKAQAVEKGIYSYDKAGLGSFKDHVPNRYIMGYFMVANSRANYGPAIWSDAISRIGRYPLSFTPFASGIKKTLQNGRDRLWQDSTFRSVFVRPEDVKRENTRRNAKHTLYYDNFSELRQIWEKETASRSGGFDTLRTENNPYYANYYYPTPTEEGAVIAYKKGLQQTGAFVLLKDGKEELLTRTGSLTDNKFAHHAGRLLWCEYKPHLRWENGGRNTLCSYDTKRKEYRYHKSRNNRFSPFFAGEYVGVVETDNENRAAIVLLSPDLKREIRKIPAGENELFIHPAFHDNRILTVVQSPRGIHIESILPETGIRERLTEPEWYEIDNPLLHGNRLFYRASYNGNNALYEKDLTTGETRHILHAPFGIRFPAVDPRQERLYFSFYTADGYRPGSIPLNRLERQVPRYRGYRLADTLQKQEGRQLNPSYDSTFSTRKYDKFTHLLNPHSWGPLYIDTQTEEARLGLAVYSQNKLSTLSLAAGYIRSDRKRGAWVLNADYKALWPVFSLNFKTEKYDYNSVLWDAYNSRTQKTDTLYLFNRSHYTSANLTMRLPFNISAGNLYRHITPYVRYRIEALHNTDVRKMYQARFKNNVAYLYPAKPEDYSHSASPNYYQMLEYGLLFSNQTRKTVQEINPRWGQVLQGGFAHTPLKKKNLGEEWWIAGHFYFPGLLPNHSLYAYSGYQKRPENTAYSQKILSPRGIRISGSEFYTWRSGYKLPLFYPDASIGSLLYVKALNGGVFFDMAHEKALSGKRDFHSYGTEVTADFHVLGLPFPVNAGFRIGYESQRRNLFADFLFTLQFNI